MEFDQKIEPRPFFMQVHQISVANRLSPLSLSLHSGQCVAIIGPNGSGKSTLLSVLAGLIRHDGQIKLAGAELHDLSWSELAKRRAMLTQRQLTPFYVPVFEVLRLGLNIEGDHRDQQQAIEAVCQVLDLNKLLARNLVQLSGGEQQRVLIARTLLQVWPSLNPHGQLLLLDEPLAGLDLHHQLALLAELKKLAQQGLLVVYAIHDINLAMEWADQVVCLKEGQLIKQGAVAVIDEALLEHVFEVKTTRIQGQGRSWFLPYL